MIDVIIIWDLEDDPQGNVQHVAEHGITVEEVEEVLFDRSSIKGVSRSSGYPMTFGYTAAGRHLAVVWEHVNDDPFMIRPITAYESPEPKRKPK